jgi:hypothetical protein
MLEFEQHIAERAKKKGINPVFFLISGARGWWFGWKGLLVCRLSPESALRSPCGIEEAGALIVIDCSKKHSLGDTGDEVADVIGTNERRQCILVGLDGLEFGGALAFVVRQHVFVRLFEGVSATG